MSPIIIHFPTIVLVHVFNLNNKERRINRTMYIYFFIFYSDKNYCMKPKLIDCNYLKKRSISKLDSSVFYCQEKKRWINIQLIATNLSSFLRHCVVFLKSTSHCRLFHDLLLREFQGILVQIDK